LLHYLLFCPFIGVLAAVFKFDFIAKNILPILELVWIAIIHKWVVINQDGFIKSRLKFNFLREHQTCFLIFRKHKDVILHRL
jgi:hypothetical protein